MDFESKAVSYFRKFITIKTVQPNPDYAGAVDFFRAYAEELGFDFKTVEPLAGKPVILICMKGKDPTSSILLNSHMDVVPVFEEHWKHPPFSGYMEDNGDIYGRGTQDMKCITIQYLEALRLLKEEGFVPKRNICLSIVPDEEIGGFTGMQEFLKTEEFKKLNVVFAMDEGLASENDVYRVFYSERSVFWVELTVKGNPGHGSLLIEDTAAEKMRKILDVFMSFRDECVKSAKEKNLGLGDRRTLNLTVVNGGVQVNVVPSDIKLSFDIRLPPDDQGEELINNLIKKTGVEMEVKYLQKPINDSKDLSRSISDLNNPFCQSLLRAFDKLGLKYQTEVFVGGTDSRFIRNTRIPAIGFSPMTNTPILLHDHNERLNRKVFVNGIYLYKSIFKDVFST